MMKVLCLLAAAVAVSADYESWKEIYANRVITAHTVMQVTAGVNGTSDDCFGMMSQFAKPENYAVSIREVSMKTETVVLCEVYNMKHLGSLSDDEKSFHWDDSVSAEVDADRKAAIHVKKPKEKEEHSISEAGIVITIILAIVFILAILACLFVCEDDKEDISGQMDKLEKREMDKEEAVSEKWERESQAAEAKEMQEAQKEMQAKEKTAAQ